MFVTAILQNHWVSLHLWVFSLKWSLLLLGLLTESLDETRLMGASPEIPPMFVTSTYRSTELHYTFGNATVSADFVGISIFRIAWITPHIWVFNLKGSLCLLAQPKESLGYTTPMGV